MSRQARGPVAYMARNGVAANLLLFFLLFAGIFSLGSLVQEVFPEFSLDTVQVSVVYPGATPEEVEESIVRKIEEQIEAVEGIKEITATASEGLGVVSVELKLGTDVSRALDDIKAEVDRIPTFPIRAERPEVRELTNRSSVVRLAIFGDASERTVKELAYRTEDALSALPEVSFVQTSGVRPYEISIDVPSATLRSLGLTLSDVADAVRRGSLDLSAGSIETRDREVRVRTVGQNYTQQDFEEIVVLSRAGGTKITLGDIATVNDGFQDADLITRYNGKRAALVEVYRTSDERALEIVEAVQKRLEADIVPSLPAGIELEIWDNSADVLQARLNLLLRNALLGLGLVLLSLTLFLNLRLAWWTAVGIGVSFVGTLAIMLLLDVSINVLSLFGFILAVGIVVDDAIVVGENIFAERERGTGPLKAAIRGATRIQRPVIFAVLTTITAFMPLLFVPGTLGKILGSIPVVVISVLFLSLFESLFILPNHLSHLPSPGDPVKNPVARFFDRVQQRVDRRFQRFVNGPLDRAIRFSIASPSVIVAGAVGLLILTVATIPSGILRIQFFPEVEGDLISANLEMPEGTPAERTMLVAEKIRLAGERVAASFEGERDPDAPDLVQGIYQVIGSRPAGGGPRGGGGAGALSGNIAGIQIQLLDAEIRDVSSAEFERRWREELGPIPEAKALTFASSIFGAGAPVAVELSHPDPVQLDRFGERVAAELRQFEGVFEIETDRDAGLTEIQLGLKPQARILGLTLDDLARQARSAFFGEEALRVQRGREDVRVYVRLPETERDAIADLEEFRVRPPRGGEVPLSSVADVSFGKSPTTIRRKNGQRILSVTARVDPQVVSGQEVNQALRANVLPALAAEDFRLGFQFGGEQEQQAESFGAIGKFFLLAILVQYALLAIPFRSYTQPLIIMSAVPFGIVGALWGHLILGIPVGLLSLFGIVGLSGVVVNDSLVMIDFINERLKAGLHRREAILEGAKARFRPIMLTSMTTFLGVAPLVFEKSVQAQFLIPMAAALGFGILFATGILVMLVPAFTAIQGNILAWIGKPREMDSGRKADQEPAMVPAGD
ncbi:MAG: efflux RND transporter permease subunit [Gemmatimonadota bacterium]